jgi:hypothetical protein
MLLTIHRLQKSLSTWDVIQRDRDPQAVIIALASMGRHHAPIVLSSPEDLGLEGIFARIGERYKGPRLRRVESAAAP